jgi:hypothetical protein
MTAFGARRARLSRHAFAGWAITGSRPPASTPSATPSPTPDPTTTPIRIYSAEPVTIESGTYRIPRSEWSLADFTVTFPEGWTAQYGHVYIKHSDGDDELGFYAVVVDEI